MNGAFLSSRICPEVRLSKTVSLSSVDQVIKSKYRATPSLKVLGNTVLSDNTTEQSA